MADREERCQDIGAWRTWWDDVTADPELAELLTVRSQRSLEYNRSSDVSYDERLGMLAEAGFAEAGTVWQSGDDRVLVGFRAG